MLGISSHLSAFLSPQFPSRKLVVGENNLPEVLCFLCFCDVLFLFFPVLSLFRVCQLRVLRPMTMETRCSKLSFQTIEKRNRLKILSYRRYGGTAAMGNTGGKMFVFLGLFCHPAVRGGTCAFTLKIINTLIKNSSRDDRPSIST